MRTLLVAIHDVHPGEEETVARLRAFLAERGAPHPTLLVVPCFHRRHPLAEHPGFVARLRGWGAEGDEVLLHGYHHLEDAPRDPGPLGARLQAALLTAGEGEFLRLDAAEAGARIRRGAAELTALGLPVAGFVAPAWLYGPGARAALRQSGPWLYEDNLALRHTDGHRAVSPVLGLSARAPHRLALSVLWTELLARALRPAPVVRLGIHPVDATSPAALTCLDRVLRRLARTHAPRSYAACARALWPDAPPTRPVG